MKEKKCFVTHIICNCSKLKTKTQSTHPFILDPFILDFIEKMTRMPTPSRSTAKKTSTRKEVRFSERIKMIELQSQEVDNYIEVMINNAEECTKNEANSVPYLEHNHNHLYCERFTSETNYAPSSDIFPNLPIHYNASLVDVHYIIDAAIAIVND
jgi:hypothetical protein